MSTQPTTLVTAAAGKTGRHTALSLLSRGFPVRAMVHREDARSAALRQRGAEIVVGNVSDVNDVRDALDGVQRAYWAAPVMPGALEAATLFAAIAEEKRLEVVVSMSQWLADPGHLSAQTRAAWLADRVFDWMATVGSITVNAGFFAETYTYTLDSVAQFGVLTLPFGEGLNAPPSNEDIAAVAAALLVDPEPHLGRSYRPHRPGVGQPQRLCRNPQPRVRPQDPLPRHPVHRAGEVGPLDRLRRVQPHPSEVVRRRTQTRHLRRQCAH